MHKYILLYILYFTSVINAQFVFEHRHNPYATHQPILYFIANHTTGPIIEFGCGDSSTNLLHEICKKQQRLLISIDDNLAWINKFKTKYLNDGYLPDNSGWHKIFFVPGKPHINSNATGHWTNFLNELDLSDTNFDVCFIDQHPWMSRIETIKKMKGHAKYVILHDCEYYAYENIIGKVIKRGRANIPSVFDFSDIYKYFRVYYPCIPWPVKNGPATLLASDTESNLPDINFNNY